MNKYNTTKKNLYGIFLDLVLIKIKNKKKIRKSRRNQKKKKKYKKNINIIYEKIFYYNFRSNWFR